MIELRAKSASVEIVEENPETQETAYLMKSVKVQAYVKPEIVEEPISWQQITDGLKRNWLWIPGLSVAFVAFAFWRWIDMMKKRLKIIRYSPPKAEETLLSA